MTMRESTYFVLASLQDGRGHGYGITQRVLELSGGRVRLPAGTLYAALDRLQAEGLITADGEEIVSGRARRYYRLTDPGAAALQAEADRMVAAARVVTDRAVLRVTPAGGTA
jgi:DNA-binding PadR family transcriptional regulator